MKINQICQDIEALLPNSSKNPNHLLSLVLHRKTGSKDVVDLIHHLGHGVSYTEILFVEDKWAEWDERQSSYIPSNIAKGQDTTHVAENIDWKKKSISGNSPY